MSIVPVNTVVAGPVWAKLSAADKEIFQKVATEEAAKCTVENHRLETVVLDEFRNMKGMVVHKVEDHDAFVTAVKPYLTAAGAPWTKEQYERLEALK